MANFKADLQGLEELKQSLNTARIPKQVALGVGVALKELNSTIEHAVATRYKTTKPLSSVLVGKSASNVTFGKNIIRGGLEYKFVPIDLSKFFSPPVVIGNINPRAKKLGAITAGFRRKGRIHYVEVIRGSRKISYGKEHRGGFIPLGWKSPMFERMSQKRLPLRTLWAPTLSQMASHVVGSDRTVIYQMNNIAETIANEIVF